jgi:RNA polymerase sigma-70 factor, ECF subfamily
MVRLSSRRPIENIVSTDQHTAFMSAYKDCHEPFMRYCSALAYSKMDAEDLVQDVLLSAYQNFDRIEKKSELLHYLVRSARNRAVSEWRKRKKEVDLTDAFTQRLSSKGASSEMLIDIKLLYSALDTLPSAQRDAIILFEITGFSMKEIADIQMSTEGAVKTLVSRGRAKLKHIMGERDSHNSAAYVLNALKSIAL